MQKYFGLALVLIAVMALSACNGQGFSSAERIISSGWADVSNEDIENQEPLYCYKTIGAIDCYKTPDQRRTRQLVSTYPTKNTARPIGAGKILHSLNQDTQEETIARERDMERARYYPTPEEQKRDAYLEAEREGAPLNIK